MVASSDGQNVQRTAWRKNATRPARSPVVWKVEKRCADVALIGNGMTNREIGERIFLSEKTIKHYVTNILQKLQVRSRVEAALLANRTGMAGKS